MSQEFRFRANMRIAAEYEPNNRAVRVEFGGLDIVLGEGNAETLANELHKALGMLEYKKCRHKKAKTPEYVNTPMQAKWCPDCGSFQCHSFWEQPTRLRVEDER